MLKGRPCSRRDAMGERGLDDDGLEVEVEVLSQEALLRPESSAGAAARRRQQGPPALRQRHVAGRAGRVLKESEGDKV